MIVPVIILGPALFVRLPYYSEGPGPTADVEPLITVTGHEVHPSEGRFLLTTVSQSARPLSPAELLATWLDPSSSVVPAELVVTPGETPEEEVLRALDQMAESQVNATSVVLDRVSGYPANHGTGVLVAAVGEGCPAEGTLVPGDVIVSVQGRPVRGPEQASERIDAVPEADEIRFGLASAREGDPPVRVRRGPCLDSKEPLIGFVLVRTFPFDVAIDDDGIGGPSAGLMWALGLYDRLTPGDLTDGRTIAGTGAITTEGTVEPIGGIGKKLLAAEEAGADLFIVPRDNLAEARAASPEIPLLVVGSFEEAVEELEVDRLGASPRPEG